MITPLTVVSLDVSLKLKFGIKDPKSQISKMTLIK